MIAPHPVVSSRGTPIAIMNRCRGLVALGHSVDLATYGIGETVELDGLTWCRAPFPGISTVKMGPSPAKVPLDSAVFLKATRLAIRGRRDYDVVHTHEEAGPLGVALARLTGLAHVYDMNNDLSVVARNYGWSDRHVMTRLAAGVEDMVLKSATALLLHSPEFANRAAAVAPSTPAEVIINVPLEPPADPAMVRRLRSEWMADRRPVALYAGSLEPYQGVDVLIDALPSLSHRDTHVVIVGGRPEQTNALQDRARSLGVHDRVAFLGMQPQRDIPSFLRAADLLVYPRTTGTNTPFKMASVMASGTPAVVTNISAHTQLMDDSLAYLVDPVAAAIAAGMDYAIEHPEDGRRRAAAAAAHGAATFSNRYYLTALARGYVGVGGPVPDEPTIDEALLRLEAAL